MFMRQFNLLNKQVDMSHERAGGARGSSTASKTTTSDEDISQDTIKESKTPVKNERKKNKKGVKNEEDVMLDTINDIRSHFEKQLAIAKADFAENARLIKAECKGQVEALHNVIKEKDNTIVKLQVDVEELKKSYSFLTQETSELKGALKVNDVKIESARKTNEQLMNKTTDLEDHSRRNNLIFYNIPEPEAGNAQNEDCRAKIVNMLKRQGFFEPDYGLEIDRAHRLGRRSEDRTRPRPVIARFCFYSDKESVLKNGKLFRGSSISACQDYSKATLEMHKQLWDHGKFAKSTFNSNKDQKKAITFYKITYR